MASFENLPFFVEGFSGKVRLFPLPNLVLFPHVIQPLHVFEPRYRDLFEDALAGDRLIAMALLRPGWESQYEGRPPLYPIACLGRITAYRRLPDGTANLLLLGLRRVRLVEELRPTRSFREAAVQICDDRNPPSRWTAVADRLRQQLRKVLIAIGQTLPESREQLDQLLSDDLPLGTLTDMMAFLFDIEIDQKESLLAETDVCRRAERLLHLLAAPHDATAFPPRFSHN